MTAASPHPAPSDRFVLQPADFSHPDLQALLTHHLTMCRDVSPPGTSFALDWSGLQAPEIQLWTLWESSGPAGALRLLGCGALKRMTAEDGEITTADAGEITTADASEITTADAGEITTADAGEIKSMHVRQEARGLGAGRRILQHLLDQARSLGLTRIYLETGTQPYFAAAVALYEAAGFVPCPPFGEYQANPANAFYRLDL